MHVRRLIGSMLATTLAAGAMSVVATAAPVAAAETVPTRIISGSEGRPVFSSYSKPLEYGDSISASVNVQALIDGVWKDIYAGSVTVTQQLAGSSSATTVASASSAYVYDSFPARGKAIYTVNYSGGTGGYPEYNYAPTSAAYSVKSVQRKLTTSTLSGKRAGFQGKLTPAKKLKITVFKKYGKKFKKYKTLRSNSKGRFTVVLPAPRRGKFYWKIVFAGDKRFAASTIKGSTYKY